MLSWCTALRFPHFASGTRTGEYFCALRAALLQGASLQPLWPIIIHDGFHSAGKVRHWNRKHLSGPQNKYMRMLLIVIIRAYNMFGHPRLYPFVGAQAPPSLSRTTSKQPSYASVPAAALEVSILDLRV